MRLVVVEFWSLDGAARPRELVDTRTSRTGVLLRTYRPATEEDLA